MEEQSWIHRKFAEFLVEFERQRLAVQHGKVRIYGQDGEHDDTQVSGPNSAWNALEALFQSQKDEAASRGGNIYKKYEEALLAMIGLADEVFTEQIKWQGSAGWKQSSLQFHFFNINNAGQVVFERIKKLLDPSQRVASDIVQIYHDVLILGFRGQYAVLPDSKKRVGQVRNQLYEALHENDPITSGQTSPQAYKYIIKETASIPLPDTRQALTFLGLVIVMFLISGFVSGCLIKSSIVESLDDLKASLGSRYSAGGN